MTVTNKKILFIDDEEEVRSIFKLFLTNMDFEFIDAPNGEIGVEMALKHIPDIIIMDYKMPVMDGIQATKKIRNYEKLKNIPIIIYTGYIDDLDFQVAKLLNKVEILKKPLDVTTWAKIINQYLYPLPDHCI